MAVTTTPSAERFIGSLFLDRPYGGILEERGNATLTQA